MSAEAIVAAFTDALPFEGLMSHAEFDAVAGELGLDPNGDLVVEVLVDDGWRYQPWGEIDREFCGVYVAPDHRLRESP